MSIPLITSPSPVNAQAGVDVRSTITFLADGMGHTTVSSGVGVVVTRNYGTATAVTESVIIAGVFQTGYTGTIANPGAQVGGLTTTITRTAGWESGTTTQVVATVVDGNADSGSSTWTFTAETLTPAITEPVPGITSASGEYIRFGGTFNFIATESVHGLDAATLDVTATHDGGAFSPQPILNGAAQSGWTATAVQDGLSVTVSILLTATWTAYAGETLVFTVTANSLTAGTLVNATVGTHTIKVLDGISISPNIIPDDGGTPMQFLIADWPSGAPYHNAQYQVHLGPLGTVQDPLAYSGVSGQGSHVTVENGGGKFIAPPVTPGNLKLTLVYVAVPATTHTTAVLGVAANRCFMERTHAYRRTTRPNWAVGPRDMEAEPYPQVRGTPGSRGFLDALYSSIGEELNEFFGLRKTRLTQPFKPATRTHSGINSATIPSSPTAVTEPSNNPVFAGVVTGQVFKILSGSGAGTFAYVLSVGGSNDTLTLATPLAVITTPFSWEVYTYADVVAHVEGALDANGLWPPISGVTIGDEQYIYQACSNILLSGLWWYNRETGQYIFGAQKYHDTLDMVCETGGTSYKAIAKTQLRTLVASAVGSDLDVIGSNLNFPRPPLLDNALIATGILGGPSQNADSIYRALILLLAYSARGPRALMESFMSALQGQAPTYWEILEFPHPKSNTIYFRRTGSNNTDTSITGKTVLPEHEFEIMGGNTTLSIAATLGAKTIYGVPFRDEGPPWIVAEGNNAFSPGLLDPSVRSNVASTFPVYAHPGDYFVITAGPQRGKRAMIRSRVDETHLKLFTPIPECIATSWRIEKTECDTRLTLPENIDIAENSGPPLVGAIKMWNQVLVGSGQTIAIAGGIRDSSYLSVTDGANAADTVSYVRQFRCTEDSYASFSMMIYVASGATWNTGGHGDQCCAFINNGARELGWGIERASATHYTIGFIEGPSAGGSFGTFISGGTSAATIPFDEWHSLEIRLIPKDPESRFPFPTTYALARLYVDGELVATIDQSQATANTSDHTLLFGLLDTTIASIVARYKSFNFYSRTARDYYNTYGTAGAVTATAFKTFTDATGPFVSGDVGKTLHIPHGSPGLRGVYQIQTYTSATVVELIKPPQVGAYFDKRWPTRIFLRGNPYAFRYPDDIGSKIVVESGTNAGTYVISKILDPVSYDEIGKYPSSHATLPGTSFLTAPWGTLAAPSPIQEYSDVLEVTSATFVDEAEITVHIEPLWPITTALQPWELCDQGSFSGQNITLPAAPPITPSTLAPFVPVMDVGFTPIAVGGLPAMTYSGELCDEKDVNDIGSLSDERYPMYMQDRFGWIGDILETLKAAGINLDFESLIRDAQGLHFLED